MASVTPTIRQRPERYRERIQRSNKIPIDDSRKQEYVGFAVGSTSMVRTSAFDKPEQNTRQRGEGFGTTFC